jgi:hypothetical protein
MSDTPESKKEALQRKCLIIISLIASMLYVNNLGSRNATSTASFLNASAINTYALFQAKNIRQNDLNLVVQTLLDGFTNTAMPLANEEAKKSLREQAEALRANSLSYESEPASGEGKKELVEKAKEAELSRNEAMQKDPYFDIAGLLLQLAIILISVVLITERRTLYVSGTVAAVAGTFLSLDGFYLFLRIPLLS